METNSPSATLSEMSPSAKWLVPRDVSKVFDNRSIAIILVKRIPSRASKPVLSKAPHS